MSPRRGKRQSKAAPASNFKITFLDLQTLQIIINHLSQDDKATFASAHPLFLSAYRNMVAKAHTFEYYSRLDIASHILASYENLTSITLGIYIENGSPSLYDLKGTPNVRHLSLFFHGDPPSRRSFSALPDNFPNLRSLHLTTNRLDRYIDGKRKGELLNSDGNLKVLSSVRHLEELKVNKIYSDDGIQHLTSLTKLTIEFPTLEDDYPPSLYCHGCESVHLDDASDLETYTKSIPWTLGTVVGRNIGTLPKLKEFILDFNTSEGSLSYSAVVNRLLLREPSRSGAGGSRKIGIYSTLSENIHSPPTSPLYFQNLESIEFRNCGGPEHFLYTPTMQRRIKYPGEGLASNDFWHTCVIWESMKNFPKLKKWRLHAFDGGLDERVEAIEVNWPCACGCGTVTGQVVEKELPCGCGTKTFVEIDRPRGL
ncbi:hypothetical protein Ndes2526B_g06532 [Nannochloris sp. 'desiccata']